MKFKMLRILYTYMLLMFVLYTNIAIAQPTTQPVKEGDQAKNFAILPPWTMRLCPKDFYATYDLNSAKLLKQADASCAFTQLKLQHLETQTTAFKTVVQDLKSVVELQKQTQLLDQKRMLDLTKQLKTEIAEKNEYKYKPNYNWIWISVGAAVALTGLAFGAGVWIAR